MKKDLTKDGLPVFTGNPSISLINKPVFIKNNDVSQESLYGKKDKKNINKINADNIFSENIKIEQNKKEIDIIISDVLNPDAKLTKTSGIYKFKSPFSKL